MPTVVISSRGAARWRAGHPWVYLTDIRRADAEPGDLVRVTTERGRPVGSAFWSSASKIALRLVAADEVVDERAEIARRVADAVAYRRALAIDATAWRAVHAEADRLPGLVVDVYGEGAARVVVVQTLVQATDRRLALIAGILRDILAPAGILARNDPKVRALEGLDERVEVVWGDVPERVRVREGPIVVDVDVRHGQKTGLFLDQRENHDVAARYARGRALDAFAYHGGFALRLAPACESVLAIDASAPAVETVRQNAARNGLSNIEAREANVFDELRELETSHAAFDTIVLDPPAFAKQKAAVERAAAGYKEINLRALRLLAPGGHLMTCTCSHHVDEGLFQAIVEHAAADARATVVIVEKRMQARDHPVLLNVPETHYLKCLVLRKLA